MINRISMMMLSRNCRQASRAVIPHISQNTFFIKMLVGLFSGGLLGGDGIFLYVCGEI